MEEGEGGRAANCSLAEWIHISLLSYLAVGEGGREGGESGGSAARGRGGGECERGRSSCNYHKSFRFSPLSSRRRRRRQPDIPFLYTLFLLLFFFSILPFPHSVIHVREELLLLLLRRNDGCSTLLSPPTTPMMLFAFQEGGREGKERTTHTHTHTHTQARRGGDPSFPSPFSLSPYGGSRC